MSVVVNLPHDLEQELADEARREGLELSEYVCQLLSRHRTPSQSPMNGKELIQYWQDRELIGTRESVTDPSEHARMLRERAQRRTLS
jgi:hypothetical protein